MTDQEKLEHMINNDQEYQQLVSEVNVFSGSKFPTTAAGLESIWTHVPKLKKMRVEEFFANFKCMLGWAVLMSRVLDKIHGIDKYDSKKSFTVGPTGQKFGLIYYENQPRFYIESEDPEAPMYISVPLKVFGGNGSETGEISFRLVGPSVLYNPMTMKYTPHLLSSVMRIAIRRPGKPTYDQPIQVRVFDPIWLALAINNSRMGD